MTAVILAACGGAGPTIPVASTTTEPTTVSSVAPTPTPTPNPYGDFSSAEVPPADPERLAEFTRLVALFPASYGSAMYLDMEFLRSTVTLSDSFSPEMLGLDLALPSIATGLVNSIAVAADFQSHAVLTSFQGDFTIAAMLQVANSFGLQLKEGSPQTYEGHNIWDVDALGVNLALAVADETTGVAASGQDDTGSNAIGLAKASLDAFDGRSARLLDSPGLTSLVSDVPSGFAAAVLSQCEMVPLFADVQALPGCAGAIATAGILSGDLVVVHVLVAFSDQDQARSALEVANKALASEDLTQGFKDLGVRQERENIRVRVIVDVSKFTDVFRLFAPSS
ncbi:MAG: hypothetical protein BZY87_07060 [SAR202 cluster bacterium Io17-Chloro-G6]|nr:MAG: hypothetical protein BZY87_07060 [SAR202 cluster bacterium Io17-Chloro-G6]